MSLLGAQLTIEDYGYFIVSKYFPKFGPDSTFIMHLSVVNHTLSETLTVPVFDLQAAKRTFPFLDFIRVGQSQLLLRWDALSSSSLSKHNS